MDIAALVVSVAAALISLGALWYSRLSYLRDEDAVFTIDSTHYLLNRDRRGEIIPEGGYWREPGSDIPMGHREIHLHNNGRGKAFDVRVQLSFDSDGVGFSGGPIRFTDVPAESFVAIPRTARQWPDFADQPNQKSGGPVVSDAAATIRWKTRRGKDRVATVPLIAHGVLED